MVTLTSPAPVAPAQVAPVRATYNITDDRLKAWFSDRISNEAYQAMRRAGFVFWHGSRCFTSVWRPEAEDLLLSHGFTIEEDDTPDDTEARVERFAVYAEKAEASALAAERYLASDRCNTDRRRGFAMKHAEQANDRAAHYQKRILASIRRAQSMERPDSIYRRIDELERQYRLHEYDAAPPSTEPRDRSPDGTQFWVRRGSRGYWVSECDFPEMNALARRWMAHIEDRLTYERARLAAAGGMPAQIAQPGHGRASFTKGGAVQWGDRGRWFEIVRVNVRTLEIYTPDSQFRTFRKITFDEVTAIATPEQVDAGEIELIRAPKIEKTAAAKVAKDGSPLVKLGYAAYSPDYSKDPAHFRWFLIGKVNPTTVKLIWLSEGKLYGRDFLFSEIQTAKGPEAAAKEAPEALARWQAFLVRKAEKRAAAKIQNNQTEAAA